MPEYLKLILLAFVGPLQKGAKKCLEPYVFDFFSLHDRAIGRCENLGVPGLFGGHNLPLLVAIGLTDLQKAGGARDNRPA